MPATSPHLLIVDDAREIREPLAQYMRKNGQRTSMAADAVEARRLIEEASIDLVVLDIMLPGEDGLSLCRWLVANTDGDKEKALRFSIEATEIEPTGANLDTCAKCHFVNGDIAKAITLQKRAIKLIPHSPPLHRQLTMFEKALNDEANLEGADSGDATQPPE